MTVQYTRGWLGGPWRGVHGHARGRRGGGATDAYRGGMVGTGGGRKARGRCDGRGSATEGGSEARRKGGGRRDRTCVGGATTGREVRRKAREARGKARGRCDRRQEGRATKGGRDAQRKAGGTRDDRHAQVGSRQWASRVGSRRRSPPRGTLKGLLDERDTG